MKSQINFIAGEEEEEAPEMVRNSGIREKEKQQTTTTTTGKHWVSSDCHSWSCVVPVLGVYSFHTGSGFGSQSQQAKESILSSKCSGIL